MNSGDLGTAATCDEVITSTVLHMVCGNFIAPRTFSVNGTPYDCVAGGTYTLPATRNGGYCMEAGPGNNAWAYFTTYP
jgi:hypothetical protein